MDDKKSTLGNQLGKDHKYTPLPPGAAPTAQPQFTPEDLDKIKAKLESFKKSLIKKYSFTRALGLLPSASFPMFEEEEALPPEVINTKPLHLIMIIPEEQFKNIPKIKPEVVKMVKDSGENFWIHIKTEVDLWNYGLDSKFDLLDAVSASFPLYDSGFLGSLRVANIHKSLVLRKFEKYVASYVIAGSLVRGNAGKDSDVDTFIIIDDTDVKRLSRVELLEKLRGIIYDYIREANALAGVKNVLNVQVYLLTDFWQSVKDAHPVMFTFIRDGIPLYDRGTFIPWKLLLKMGRIKPSPEAVDMFMKSGDQTDSLVKRRLIDAMVDIYWGVVTPTQALMMLAGNAPPEPKAIVAQVKEVLVDKEKLMDMKELKFLEKIVKLYKDHEHGKLNSIPGAEVDSLMKNSEIYVKKMKDLRKKLEIRMGEHTAEKLYSEVYALLKNLFGNKAFPALIKDLESQLVKKGKINPRVVSIAKEVLSVKQKIKSKKLTQSDMERVSRDAYELINALTDYAQRKDLVKMEKGLIQIAYKGRKAEIVITDHTTFLSEAGNIRKLTDKGLVESDKKELEEALNKSKGALKGSLSSRVMDALKKELGDFEIVM